jgi:hypothetical protein
MYMKKLSAFSVVTAILAVNTAIASSSWAKSPTSNSQESGKSDRVAQLYYPPVSDRQGIMVFGQGQVRLPADKARLEFTFVREAPTTPTPNSTPAPDSDSTLPLPTTKPITKENLQPVVDAIANLGIPTKDIKVEIDATSIIPLSATKPKITFEVDKPTRSRIDTIVNQVKDSAKYKAKVTVEAINVGYAVKDCQKLTTAAYQAAVKDAKSRAEAIASSLKVKLSDVPTVSESFFYDIVVPLCVTETGESLPLPIGYGELRVLPPYNPEAPAEVQLRRDLFVTYPIKD